MMIPQARGEFSDALFAALRVPTRSWEHVLSRYPEDRADFQIALWTLYELHYRGFRDASQDWEWNPGVLQIRARLEREFEQGLRFRHAESDDHEAIAPTPDALAAYIESRPCVSVAARVQRDATEDQVLELLMHRSIYHLKESDPVSWVVPRLSTAPKAALMELQYDEYGCGDPNRLHSHLFALGMQACGLSPDYGAYIDDAPTEVLEQNNAMSLFGLHRRLRGAALGHLAAFEATSSGPSRRMSAGLSRLGLTPEMIAYYDAHVTADALHEQLALRTICDALLTDQPELLGDVLFGIATCIDLENRFAERTLRSWSDE